MRDIPESVRALERDLVAIFGNRMQSLIVYSGATGQTNASARTMVVVTGLSSNDLGACAERLDTWHDAGVATPLILAAHEFERSLDAFPFEFGAILADHALVSGVDPFTGLVVDPLDLRRASETRARSHLLHLREGYVETRGRGDAIADLIARSAAPLAALVTSVARLQGRSDGNVETAARNVESAAGLSPGSIVDVVMLSDGRTLSSDEARRMLPRYLEAVEKLANSLDQWKPL